LVSFVVEDFSVTERVSSSCACAGSTAGEVRGAELTISVPAGSSDHLTSEASDDVVSDEKYM